MGTFRLPRTTAFRLTLLACYWSLTTAFAALNGPLDMIVVAGAGPASLVFAYQYLLQNRFARVRIIDKNPRPVPGASDAVYRFEYGLGARARAVLNSIPGLLPRVEAIAAFTRSERWGVNREELCAVILEALDRDFEGRLDLWFDTEVQVFYDDCTVDVLHDDGKTDWMRYSLLVAGDGANSVIRNALIEKGEVKCTRFLRPVSWKALALPKQPNLAAGAFLPYPRTKSDFGALLPQRDGTFLLLSYWAKRRRRPQVNPWDVENPKELRACIRQAFPEITEFPAAHELRRFLDEPPGRETFMKLDKHASQKYRVALIGDAAVGMYSFMGQNFSYAMESADRLARVLAESRNLREALAVFSAESVVQGHAIADINLLAHLQEKLFLKRAMVDMREMTVKLNDPNLSYEDILRDYDWKIRLSRWLWRLERLPISNS